MTTCGEYDVQSAADWGLLPGEQYELDLQASPMRLDHPLRHQHRRIFLAVREAGLAKPFMKRRPPESKRKEEESSATLLLFCAAYGLGVFVSTLALMSEVLWHKWVNRRRNSGGTLLATAPALDEDHYRSTLLRVSVSCIRPLLCHFQPL
ncbi:hypothetical protein MTO96_041233 [Rhipicephalus appendiculatus]